MNAIKAKEGEKTPKNKIQMKPNKCGWKRNTIGRQKMRRGKKTFFHVVPKLDFSEFFRDRLKK